MVVTGDDVDGNDQIIMGVCGDAGVEVVMLMLMMMMLIMLMMMMMDLLGVKYLKGCIRL